MRVQLRSRLVAHPGGEINLHMTEIDLPDCLVDMSGQPLILGLTTSSAMAGSQARIWYVSDYELTHGNDSGPGLIEPLHLTNLPRDWYVWYCAECFYTVTFDRVAMDTYSEREWMRVRVEAEDHSHHIEA